MSQVKGISISNSGMDIDSLVKSSVATYQNKYDAAYKKKIVAEWTKSAYADLYSSLSTFRKGTAYDFHLDSSTTAHTVTSGDNNIVTATANGDAMNMSHDVIVNAVAKNASLQSTTSITRAASSSSSTSVKLADIAGITIDDTNKDSDKVALSFDVQDSASSTTSHTVSYTYKQLQDATLNDFAADIKGLGLNINASYDSTNDSMSIYNQKGGDSNVIKITANAPSASTSATADTDTNTLLSNLKLGSYSEGALTSVNTTDLASGNIKGTSSSITVDGRTYTGDSNTITVNGVTYTAIKPSATSTTRTNVSVGTDTDALVKSVQKFVDSYNEILDKLNTQLHASKYSAYGALTTDEEEKMSDKQLENWEEKAKSGLLKNDSIISGIVSDMRSAVSQKVEGLTGEYTTLASIGIEVGKGSNSYKEYGKLHLDTTKLTTAIGKDPDIVNKLFTSNNTSTSTKDEDIEKQGIGTRLYNLMNKGLSKIETQAGTSASTDSDTTSYLGMKIDGMEKNLKVLLKNLQNKETYYYTKYNKMESAIGTLNSSITSLTSMLG
jgi:flagellar hook-associated protein 2